ncbi:Na(+)-translocating NADH-quinone reductase subunit F [Aequorivita echinoideorum]|uniref:Na(+)-translocating NADH-quinone reductase subunit F n=1 Tax=Aequorivita echinoideorum TaxID=1549647 RepID=A0ABS5S2E2_9FLAO|nr:Na(+)-translocating NADH-quinone reductase subunit F [Aequorivita echinoideorum]MBT0606614.1 Na(+)-translocating NADH-quinone reductase subunit F [Aequorivita echinoideorum]
MQLTSRLERAIGKLYNAFHDGTLNPECCNHCAVGNICDNTDSWKYLSDAHGSVVLNYVGLVNQKFGKRISGYTPLELLQTEAAFLKGCGYSLPLNYKSIKPKDPTSKETLFNGLCAAIEYLCALDGIENVMDYKSMFQFEVNSPKMELQPV